MSVPAAARPGGAGLPARRGQLTDIPVPTGLRHPRGRPASTTTKFRSRVGEHEVDLGCGEAGVDQHRDRPGQLGPVVGDGVPPPVRESQTDPVARLDAPVGQPSGDR